MHTPTPTFKSTLILAVFLAVFAAAVGTMASFEQPAKPYPDNTEPPVDMGLTTQAKTGGLAVRGFLARGNASFNQDIIIKSSLQGGIPSTSKTVSTVTIGSNTLVTGDLKAGGYLNSATLKHSEAQPKPLCNDAAGNIIFC